MKRNAIIKSMEAIRCTNLHKTYLAKPPVKAVRGIDLTVRAGECFSLLGPNGAGKTTTMEILEGLLDADSAEVQVFGMHWGKNLVQLPMFLLSGVFFSSERFPEVIQPLIEILPLTALNDALRGIMPDGAGHYAIGDGAWYSHSLGRGYVRVGAALVSLGVVDWHNDLNYPD